ncbi:hypothetical protein RZ60_05970 [[Haemophilus] ducreyi]|uniref:Uncharacterized protein n=2 Tax=Haemophilus ducreyi TaxID=730 RepID=Q7VL66_HAEDU|nr:hypothetical protein [[Haemophilus] ducreyi]AAP96393.1 hypothetical protein HD_1615 [[Haemophilus] ducreyi 35000HP]AKO31274.1 hypothetical protein RY60_06165 [[Haemophilus] ducreyi]AKO32721.1 hypothetical protein RZ57_06230 [[Haemophilus] ducreyi]AKO35614.1 hypothetical protein RZ59_06155 [[Haemophilus] ducreyi]AKO37074.1 hypothetical protein RZ61_06350 [[Haemophilus] ducreyi]
MGKKIKTISINKTKGKVGLAGSSQIIADNNDRKPPVFSFHHIKKDYCLDLCDSEEKLHLLKHFIN